MPQGCLPDSDHTAAMNIEKEEKSTIRYGLAFDKGLEAEEAEDTPVGLGKQSMGILPRTM